MEDAERQQLLDENASLRAEIAQLKQTIDTLVRRIFGTKSEALDPAQLELLLGSDFAKKVPAVVPADPGPAAEIPSHQKKTRKQTRAPRIPEHLPVTEQILTPPEVLADPSAWRRIGEETREQLHYQRGRFSRIRTVRPKYVRIGDPLAKPVIAPLPPSLQDRCIATPSLIAEVLDNRFTCHLPYYRQAEMFTRLGVRLHRKTLCDWALLAFDWLAIIYREIQYEHWRCTYRQLDETPIDYLQPGHGKTKTGYLWVSNIPSGSVIYHWRKGRDQGAITDLFDSDPGTTAHPTVIQSDGYSAYPAWAKGKDHITLMGCHAHVRRKFFEAKDQSQRLKKLFDKLALRPTKLGAKNWLFIGAEHAGEKSAIIYTLVENCRRLGIDAREYFEDVLTRLPAMKASDAAGLTPANWHKAKKARSRKSTHAAA